MDEVTTRIGREHGRLVQMVIKRQLSREVLEQVADELEELSKLIRGLTNAKR